ncbi:MAG: hypothetical protein U1D97_12445 [Desulfuromonadales bacterium]|nr:hypothetical protein [Desulfuromonadales bacterium]
METRKKIILAFFAFFGLLFVIGALAPKSPDVPYKILSVSDFPHSMSDRPAVIISIGKDDSHMFTFTILREQVRQGFATSLPANIPVHPLSVYGYLDGQIYITSTKHATNASLAINNIDHAKKIAEITVFGRVIDSKDFNNFVDIPKVTLQIAGVNFDNLVKQIPVSK